MLRWAVILFALAALLAVLGFSGAGGALADLAQMLLWVVGAAALVFAALAAGSRRKKS